MKLLLLFTALILWVSEIQAQARIDRYKTETPAFELTLPLHVTSLADFVNFGRSVSDSESYQAVIDLWRRRVSKDGAAKVRRNPNAWISIEEDEGAALCARWTVEPGAADKKSQKTDAIFRDDEFSFIQALQDYAIRETKFEEVVELELKLVTWHNLPGRIPDITHQRFGMHWKIHLQKGGKKGEHSVYVFPAKPKEEGRPIGKSGLRALFIYIEEGNDWSRAFKSNGGSTYTE